MADVREVALADHPRARRTDRDRYWSLCPCRRLCSVKAKAVEVVPRHSLDDLRTHQISVRECVLRFFQISKNAFCVFLLK